MITSIEQMKAVLTYDIEHYKCSLGAAIADEDWAECLCLNAQIRLMEFLVGQISCPPQEEG